MKLEGWVEQKTSWQVPVFFVPPPCMVLDSDEDDYDDDAKVVVTFGEQQYVTIKVMKSFTAKV